MGQAVDADDRAAALGDLLADGAQLVGITVVQDCVEGNFILGPVRYQLDAGLNFFWQASEERFAGVGFRPYS